MRKLLHSSVTSRAAPAEHSRRSIFDLRRFVRVAQNLYRYTKSKTYYAVFRTGGKLKWKCLNTDDRELAQRRLRDAMDSTNEDSLERFERDFREILSKGDTEETVQWVKQRIVQSFLHQRLPTRRRTRKS